MCYHLQNTQRILKYEDAGIKRIVSLVCSNVALSFSINLFVDEQEFAISDGI